VSFFGERGLKQKLRFFGQFEPTHNALVCFTAALTRKLTVFEPICSLSYLPFPSSVLSMTRGDVGRPSRGWRLLLGPTTQAFLELQQSRNEVRGVAFFRGLTALTLSHVCRISRQKKCLARDKSHSEASKLPPMYHLS
jgi:hypothetical protein